MDKRKFDKEFKEKAICITRDDYAEEAAKELRGFLDTLENEDAELVALQMLMLTTFSAKVMDRLFDNEENKYGIDTWEVKDNG